MTYRGSVLRRLVMSNCDPPGLDNVRGGVSVFDVETRTAPNAIIIGAAAICGPGGGPVKVLMASVEIEARPVLAGMPSGTGGVTERSNNFTMVPRIAPQ